MRQTVRVVLALDLLQHLELVLSDQRVRQAQRVWSEIPTM